MKSLRESLLTDAFEFSWKGNTIFTQTEDAAQFWSLDGKLKTVQSVAGASNWKLLNENKFSYFRYKYNTTYIGCANTGNDLHAVDKGLFVTSEDDFCIMYKSTERLSDVYTLDLDSYSSQCMFVTSAHTEFYICGTAILAIEEVSSRRWSGQRWKGTVITETEEKVLFDKWYYPECTRLSTTELYLDTNPRAYIFSSDDMSLRESPSIGNPFKALDGTVKSCYAPDWSMASDRLFKVIYRYFDADLLLSMSQNQLVNFCADQFGWP